MDSRAGRAARSPLDVSVTVIGLVLLMLLIPVAVWASAVINFASDPCGNAVFECNRALIRIGVGLPYYGATIVGAVALIASVVTLRAGRRAWWIPWVAIVMVVGLYAAGTELAGLGVQLA